MLSPDQIATVKQTIPVLEAHGETLTRHFYTRMFAHNPEVKPYFNPAHQREGAQQRALAGAILAYARHIDDTAALAPAVEVIAHKHASLTIRPEHYPIVGENLIASIQEVLGDAATPDIIDAWEAAYAQLAKVFIGRERELYTQQRDTQGWAGFRPFTIVRRQAESENIVSLYLAPSDGRTLPEHAAGQYVTLRMTDAAGNQPMRQYSLSNAPGSETYRLSIKHETGNAEQPAGQVSPLLHTRLVEGDQVELTPPYGTFGLALPEDPARPVVLIGGGVGITPLISMAHAALAASPERRVVMIQLARHAGVRAFGEELAALTRAHANVSLHLCYDEPRADAPADSVAGIKHGLLEAADLAAWVGDSAASYHVCGPLPMMRALDRLLAEQGVSAKNRHYECFGPSQVLAS
ncbi:NO-inducible flavohemoprotein [Salinicola endophyticus]|uniref:nitric oxide dioxygenase n=1 Tax=Salinicola endophyticus TaxID=1949083 RepID=A0ABY8FHN3_9GAMM|nr:NO-inducible flavohemoprotein [Salinicola endophyticus]WFF42334.1 NO-inducible flavohemoprotein [Salinicola endophyticus]